MTLDSDKPTVVWYESNRSCIQT